MQKSWLIILICVIGQAAWTQPSRQTTPYVSFQYNKTLHDYTIGNNPWGIGIGVQVNFLDQRFLKPVMELTLDAYLEDDKVLRLYPGGSAANDVGGMINLFGGVAYEPWRRLYIAGTTGISLTAGQVLFGFKPSAGVYVSQRRGLLKFSYINLYHRGTVVKENLNHSAFP